MSSPSNASEQTAAEFLSGLRVAVAVISGVILLTLGVVWHRDVYEPAWPQFAAYAALLSITVVGFILALRRRPWGNLRWPGVGIALAASVASCLSLPNGGVASSADWAFGAVGWSGLILLLDRRLRAFVAFLVVHECITFGNLLASSPDGAALLSFVSGSIGPIGFPLATGIGATALRRVARIAEKTRQRAAKARLDEEVSAGVHEFRRDRLATLSETTIPLLRGLADESLDIADPVIQHNCSMAAAQLRRLFQEAAETPNALSEQIRAAIVEAEQRGVKVEWNAHGKPPTASDEIVRAFEEITSTALASVASEAQVTLMALPGEVQLTVVGAGDVPALPQPRGVPVEVEVFSVDGQFGMEAQWRTGESPL